MTVPLSGDWSARAEVLLKHEADLMGTECEFLDYAELAEGVAILVYATPVSTRWVVERDGQHTGGVIG